MIRSLTDGQPMAEEETTTAPPVCACPAPPKLCVTALTCTAPMRRRW